MNKTAWIIFSAITVGAFGLLVYLSGSNKIDVSKADITAAQTASTQNGNIADHVYGKAGSKVTLIDYGDFQCPGCGTAHPTIKAVTEAYKDQLQFIFRNYPLTESHPNAKAAAGAVEAAGLQGKYWEMHNKIYESQSEWENLEGSARADMFSSYAKTLGLNADKFNVDISGSAINKKIEYDKALGQKAKLDATPSFYLNGKKLPSSTWGDETKLKEAINTELKKAGITPPSNN